MLGGKGKINGGFRLSVCQDCEDIRDEVVEGSFPEMRTSKNTYNLHNKIINVGMKN